MNETNLDRLCRLCLRNSFFYMPIYVGQSVDNNPIYEIINYVYGLEVFVDDGLPEYICGDCLAKLKEFEIYKRNVHKAKSELLSLKRSVDDICIKEEEIDEMGLKDEQITNEAEIKSPSRGGNGSLSDEDNGGRLEVYIKQENVEEEHLQESSEDERLENLDQDEVSNIKVDKNEEEITIEGLPHLTNRMDDSTQPLASEFYTMLRGTTRRPRGRPRRGHTTPLEPVTDRRRRKSRSGKQRQLLLQKKRSSAQSQARQIQCSTTTVYIKQENVEEEHLQEFSEDERLENQDDVSNIKVEKNEEEITIEGLPHLTNRMDDSTQPLASEICIKEEEIDEMGLKDEQITNEAEIKSPSRGGNGGVSDEDNGGRLEVYIKQENVEEEYLQESSEDERLENLDQDEVSNIKVEKNEEEITIEGLPQMTNRMDDSTQPLASEVLDRVQCYSRSYRSSKGMDKAVVENYFGHTSTGHFGLKRKGSMKDITLVKVRTNMAENFSECNAPSENFKSCDSIPFDYPCEICGMRFKTSEGRTVHESIHLKVNRASKTYSKGSSIKRNSLSPQRNTDVNSLNAESLQILVRNSEESHGNLKELVSKESCIQPSPSAVNASQVHTKSTTILGKIVNRYPIQENISTNMNSSVTSSLNSSVFDTLSTTFEFIHVPDQNLVIPKIRVFSCHFCKKYFPSKTMLYRHMHVHAEKKS